MNQNVSGDKNKTQTQVFFPLHSQCPLQYLCHTSVCFVFKCIDLPSDFLKGSWVGQGQAFFQLKKKMCKLELFIFLRFVPFVLIRSEEIALGRTHMDMPVCSRVWGFMGCRVGVVGAGACGGWWLCVSMGGHGLGLRFSGTVYWACVYTQCVVTNEIRWPSVSDCEGVSMCVCLDWGCCDLLWPNGSCVPVPGSASLSGSPG